MFLNYKNLSRFISGNWYYNNNNLKNRKLFKRSNPLLYYHFIAQTCIIRSTFQSIFPIHLKVSSQSLSLSLSLNQPFTNYLRSKNKTSINVYMQTDLNPVYINYIRWKKKEGRRERDREKKTGGHASNGKAQFYYRYDEISDGGAWSRSRRRAYTIYHT